MTSIPSIRGVHHFAHAVPNLDEAVTFLTDVLGAEIATRFGPLADPDGNTFAERPGIHLRAELRSALLGYGPTLNIEVHEYHAPDQRHSPTRQSDPGASHLGVWVDDLKAAAEYLRNQPGVVVRTIGPGGPPELDGLTNFFFETPRGTGDRSVDRGRPPAIQVGHGRATLPPRGRLVEPPMIES